MSSNSEFKPINKKEIILHIGLPKTATTHLQKEIFPNLEGITYVGRAAGLNDSIARRIGFCFMHPAESACFAPSLHRCLNSLHQRLLISHEGITGIALPHTIRPHISLDVFSERIRRLCHDLSSFTGANIKIFLVLRKHDEWLVSRYANLAKNRYMATQSDFEKFVEKTLNIDQPMIYPSLLHYQKLNDNLVEIFGRGNVCILSFSQLRDSPEKFFNEMLSFFGCANTKLKKVYRSNKKKTNVLATGDPDTWALRPYEGPFSTRLPIPAKWAIRKALSKLPRIEQKIILTSDLSLSINAHYADSIEWLATTELDS